MTMSILGRCGETGMMGMVVASSSIAVASRCAFAEAGVGVVASQNVTDPRLGPRCLRLLRDTKNAEKALSALLDDAENTAYRQLAVLDLEGNSAFFSGSHAMSCFAGRSGKNCVAVGNMLANERVADAMVEAFVSVEGILSDRLLSALEAGLVAGGEIGPVHSAGMKIVDQHAWPFVDLRIDWTLDGPVGQLRRLWQEYEPQAQDFVDRAIRPESAPAFHGSDEQT